MCLLEEDFVGTFFCSLAACRDESKETRQYQQLFIFSGEISSGECVPSNVKPCLLGFVDDWTDPVFAWRRVGFARSWASQTQSSKALTCTPTSDTHGDSWGPWWLPTGATLRWTRPRALGALQTRVPDHLGESSQNSPPVLSRANPVRHSSSGSASPRILGRHRFKWRGGTGGMRECCSGPLQWGRFHLVKITPWWMI